MATNYCVLTNAIQKQILTRISKALMEKNVKGFYPHMMNEKKMIFCFLDLKQIEIGSSYVSINGHGKTRKYFHENCYERMHY